MSPCSETLTVRLSPEIKARPESLSLHTRRTKSFLAGEAINGYVERELAIVQAVHRGLDDFEEGRTTSHEDAMRRLRATVDRTRQGG